MRSLLFEWAGLQNQYEEEKKILLRVTHVRNKARHNLGLCNKTEGESSWLFSDTRQNFMGIWFD